MRASLRSWRSLAFPVIAIVLGCGLSLALAEVGLRAWEAWRAAPVAAGQVDTPKALLYRTAAGKRITPNLDVVIRRHPTSGRDVRVRTNSLGLRGPEVPPRAPKEFRVLVLGDSITFGDYVDEAETYPAVLERLLQAARPGQPVRVINAGGPNLGTRDEAALLAELAPVLAPDVVLVGFYLNDGLDQVPYPHTMRLPEWLRRSRLVQRVSDGWEKARHRARVAPRFGWVKDFLARGWVTDRAAFERVIALADSDWGAAWHDWSWRPVEEGLLRMTALARAHRFRLAMAAFPASVQVESRFEDARPQQRARALAERLGLPFLDLLPSLRAASDRWLFHDQCHLTPAGNALAAVALASFVDSLAAGAGAGVGEGQPVLARTLAGEQVPGRPGPRADGADAGPSGSIAVIGEPPITRAATGSARRSDPPGTSDGTGAPAPGAAGPSARRAR